MTNHLISTPTHPLAAAVHPDPYPYYAQLLAQRPLCFDPDLNLWVASSAETVKAVLTSELCHVRPSAEPIPKALLGSSAAEIFGSLVRMNDGALHCPLKSAATATLAMVTRDRAKLEAQRWASELLEDTTPQSIDALMVRLPSFVVGSLLGLPQDALPRVAQLIGAFARCIAPNCPPADLERDKAAAAELLEIFSASADSSEGGLLSQLTLETRRFGLEGQTLVLANAIGFLFQAYDATAGLIGNTLVQLARQPALLERVQHQLGLLSAVIEEVLRFDPPVQNTRRFVVKGGEIAGQALQSGDAILVLLAAANRDPAFNADPDDFQPARFNRRSFAFGAGVHSCPGEHLATGIAEAGVARVLDVGINPHALLETMTYRASPNARIPVFSRGAAL